jgi:hypothetical protein
MSRFAEGQRVRVTADYATVNGKLRPDLEKWVGLEGIVLIPRQWEGGFDVVILDNPPEDCDGFPFLKGEIEAIEP